MRVNNKKKVHESEMKKGRNERSKKEGSIINPSRPPLRNGTFVIPKRLLRREEASAIIAQELADLSMLRDFMP